MVGLHDVVLAVPHLIGGQSGVGVLLADDSAGGQSSDGLSPVDGDRSAAHALDAHGVNGVGDAADLLALQVSGGVHGELAGQLSGIHGVGQAVNGNTRDLVAGFQHLSHQGVLLQVDDLGAVSGIGVQVGHAPDFHVGIEGSHLCSGAAAQVDGAHDGAFQGLLDAAQLAVVVDVDPQGVAVLIDIVNEVLGELAVGGVLGVVLVGDQDLSALSLGFLNIGGCCNLSRSFGSGSLGSGSFSGGGLCSGGLGSGGAAGAATCAQSKHHGQGQEDCKYFFHFVFSFLSFFNTVITH